MTKRGGNDPGKKPARGAATGTDRLGSGLGRSKGGSKSRSSANPAVPKNLYETKGTSRRAAPVANRNLTITAGKTRGTTTERVRQKKATDTGLGKITTGRMARFAAVLAHYKRPITAAEARAMNKIIEADQSVPELRPRRR
ncbi:hypothetical protein [Streptomyces chartreusis]|uniref:Uncharacterized protein n=1 Tax=Streptomyces chartreusis TaxID=1969 RepID=A0A7H8TA46_STRCX|nr:hypothetical protein [Streptomyces chartreusis]QKZ20346.1 hypothetical protein HUT05_25140 [Streptomyces chartreusis]